MGLGSNFTPVLRFKGLNILNTCNYLHFNHANFSGGRGVVNFPLPPPPCSSHRDMSTLGATGYNASNKFCHVLHKGKVNYLANMIDCKV